MSPRLTILTAAAGSGKTGRLLDRYRRALAESRPGETIWLAPTWRAAADVRGRLLGDRCCGCFSPNVMTFDQFAEAVLQVSPVAYRPVSRSMKRHLIRRLIASQGSAGRLKHFGSIANTTGLVDLVCELISDLKRWEIWPEHFLQARGGRAARGPGPPASRLAATAKDEELFEIYDAYQQSLRERQLYDAEGRFWSARDRLEQGQRRPFERLRLVVADGFADFTRTQHEILQILAGRVEQMWITLPLEAEPRRRDLFDKPLTTLEALRRRHPDLLVEELPRTEHPRWPAMAHLEKTLFANPRHVQPAEDTAGVEILAAARRSGEIELIGSRIKRLLTEGDRSDGGRPVRPGEIAVVFRSTREIGPLVAEVFTALGIPFTLETGLPLDRSPGLVALVGLLRLDHEDWPFAQLLAVLANNYFRPSWPEWQENRTAAAAERAIRRLEIPRGRERLLERLRALADDSRDRSSGSSEPASVRSDSAAVDRQRDLAPTESRESDDRRHQARITLALLRRLAAAFDELPQRAGPAGWAKAWQRLARRTGLLRAMGLDAEEAPARDGPSAAAPAAPMERSPTLAPDRRAWERLQGALADSETLDRWLGQEPARTDRGRALEMLRDLLASEQLGQEADESGRVRVLSAASARALRVPHLFLAGLSEHAFPSPQRTDRLYSEAECRQLIDDLIASGLPLVGYAERSRDEMLLFYETMTRASRRLYLSYPGLDDSAQPLLPSPYLSEIEQACGRDRIKRTERTDLSPIPAGDEPLSAAEFRVKALSTALADDVSLLAGMVRREPAVAENVLAGLELTDMRGDTGRFGPAEGLLPGDAAGGELARRFPADRAFSATDLERYASCPFQFFASRVLRLEPIEELDLAIDYLARGRLAHELLASFHRRVNQRFGGDPSSPAKLDQTDYDRLVDRTLDELTGRAVDNPVRAGLREVDRRLVGQWMTAYRRQHEQYDASLLKSGVSLAPEFFEVSFGHLTGGDDPPSTDRALQFFAGEQTIRVSGRIDRIDTGRVGEETLFNVLDYKTGGSIRLTKESVAKGLTLQLPLYALAAAELFMADRDAVPWTLAYWYLRDKGCRTALKTYDLDDGVLEPSAAWEEIRGGLAETVAGLVRGIRAGRFPVWSQDDRCTGYCPYHTICRINQVRSLGKTWPPETQND